MFGIAVTDHLTAVNAWRLASLFSSPPAPPRDASSRRRQEAPETRTKVHDGMGRAVAIDLGRWIPAPWIGPSESKGPSRPL